MWDRNKNTVMSGAAARTGEAYKKKKKNTGK